MTKTVSAYEARTKLGDIMNEVYYNNIEVIVERMGKPTVKIVSCRAQNTDSTSRVNKLLDLAGSWSGASGKKIEENFQKLRKKAKLTSF